MLSQYFIMGRIWLQHVKLLIITGDMKVQGNSKAVENIECLKYAACEFGKVRC